jgi:toxin ParE1/3/4
VYDTADLLARFPELGRVRSDLGIGVRSFPIEGYMICYRIDENVVTIARILDQRQNIPKQFGTQE